MLTRYNPDYNRFQQLPTIHPLIWGKRELSQLTPVEKHMVAFFGPAAAGKDTILQNITFPFTQVKTHTTREKRTHTTLETKYIFIRPEQFEALKQRDEFIETLLQTAGNYGTTKTEVEKALQSTNQIIVWRGEETGLPAVWTWLTKTHPTVQHHVVFVLPKMSLVELAARIIQKRGLNQAEGRVKKAIKEIIDAGSIADFLVLNPPQQDGPRDATIATHHLFAYLLKR